MNIFIQAICSFCKAIVLVIFIILLTGVLLREGRSITSFCMQIDTIVSYYNNTRYNTVLDIMLLHGFL